MQEHPDGKLADLCMQVMLACLLLVLVRGHEEITFERAARVQVRMERAEVEAILGKPNRLEGCVFVPIVKTREDRSEKVDAIGIVPSFYPIGPGLESYTLHSPQEEFPAHFGQHSFESHAFWLDRSCSVVVFFGAGDRVAKFFVLPTTIERGDVWVRMQWMVSQWWERVRRGW